MDTITLIGLIASLMSIIGIPGILQIKKLGAIDEKATEELKGFEMDFAPLFWKTIKILFWFCVFYFSYKEFQIEYDMELINNPLGHYKRSGFVEDSIPGIIILIVFWIYILLVKKKLVFWEIISYLLIASVFAYYTIFVFIYGMFWHEDGVLPFVISLIFALLASNYLYKKRISSILIR